VIYGSQIFITLVRGSPYALVFCAGTAGGAARISCFPRADRFAWVPRAEDRTGSSGCVRGHRGALSATAWPLACAARSATRAQGVNVCDVVARQRRISLPAGAVGVAQGCVDASVSVSVGRTQIPAKPLRTVHSQGIELPNGIELKRRV